MSVRIRLRQQGRANRQTFRLVVTDIRNPRDGKYLEMVGWYNPFGTAENCQVDADRIRFWLSQGAQLTPNAISLLVKVAPDVVKEMRAHEQAKKMKEVAKRRAKKKAA